MVDMCTDSVPFNSNCTNWNMFEKRLSSFTNWPRQMKQSSRTMAQAGFVYLNRGDSCFCFKCELIFKGWESTDNPWLEHKKWSPDCDYINMVGIIKKKRKCKQIYIL